MLIQVIVIVCLAVQSISIKLKESETRSQSYGGFTYHHKKVVCYKCPPSHYVKEHCRENFKKSRCKLCKEGCFQSEYTQAESCELCQKCDENHQTIDTLCTGKQDTKCTCEQGYVWKMCDGIGYCRKIDAPTSDTTSAVPRYSTIIVEEPAVSKASKCSSWMILLISCLLSQVVASMWYLSTNE